VKYCCEDGPALIRNDSNCFYELGGVKTPHFTLLVWKHSSS
jgi:hypothetical protein